MTVSEASILAFQRTKYAPVAKIEGSDTFSDMLAGAEYSKAVIIPGMEEEFIRRMAKFYSGEDGALDGTENLFTMPGRN